MGKSDRDSHLKPHPTCGNPQSGGVSQIQSFSLRIKGFMPHIRPPDPWDLQWRDEPPLPKCLTLKTKGGSWSGDTFLKMFVHRLPHPGSQCKSSPLTGTQTICERDLFTILKHLPEEQKPADTLSRDGALARIIFVLSLYFNSAGGRAPALHAPTTLLEVVGMHSPHRGCFLIAWLWGSRGLCSWAPRDCNYN